MRLRFERRLTLTGRDAAITSILAIIVGLALFSIIFILAGVNPLYAYKEIFSYAFMNVHGLSPTIARFIFLLLCTLAFILPFRAGLWNIGMTGQFYFGVLGAYGVLYAFTGAWTPSPLVPPPDPSPVIVIPLMIIAAALCGAGAGAIAGFLKGKLNVNEIVVTMMLNFVAYWLVMHMITGGPFMNPAGRSESFNIVPSVAGAPFILGSIFEIRYGGYWGIPFTIFLALGIAALVYFLFAKTKIGYQIKALGHNPAAARYSGVNPFKITLLVFIVGGAIAGIAGYHYFGGPAGVDKFMRGYNKTGDLAFYGIICGLISLGNPLAAIPITLLFGGLIEGARNFQGMAEMAFGMHYALLGVIMITLVAFQFFYRYRIVLVKKSKGRD